MDAEIAGVKIKRQANVSERAATPARPFPEPGVAAYVLSPPRTLDCLTRLTPRTRKLVTRLGL